MAFDEFDHGNCGSCFFYFPTPRGNRGKCHRFPPSGMYGDFVSVLENNWCGEFKKSKSEKEK